MLCYLSLGSNLGERARQLAAAIAALADHRELLLRRCSPVYETVPMIYTTQSLFLNLVLIIQASCEPPALLHFAQQTETALGRTRPFRYAPRTIDIDLLMCDEIVMNTPELTLPHPRMAERQFVLTPLADLVPNLQLQGRPLGQLADRTSADVRLVGKLSDVVRRGY